MAEKKSPKMARGIFKSNKFKTVVKATTSGLRLTKTGILTKGKTLFVYSFRGSRKYGSSCQVLMHRPDFISANYQVSTLKAGHLLC